MQTVPAKWNDILAGNYQVDFKAVINGKPIYTARSNLRGSPNP